MKDGWSTFRGLRDWVKGIFDNSGSLRVGAKVSHPSYGEGIIEQIQGSGATARVCVDFGFAKPIVSLSELKFEGDSIEPVSIPGLPQQIEPSQEASEESEVHHIQEEQAPKPQNVASQFKPDPSFKDSKQMTEIEVEARKGIMALRLGQVLESQISDLSVGTAELEQKLHEAISSTIANGPTFLLVDAAWGAGKTHALTMLQVLALRTQFATSYVVMDGISTWLAEPNQLMSELMCSLRFPGSTKATDLSYHLARAKQDERIEILEKRGAEYVADTLGAFPIEAFDDPEVLDLLTDFFSLRLPATQANKQLSTMNYKARLKGIRASRIADRIPRFVILLGEWAVFASVMGCNGLLVVLDELDVEYATSAYGTLSDRRTIDRRQGLLRELRKLTKIPLIVAFAAAPGDPSLDVACDPVRDVIACLGNKAQHIKVPSPSEKDFHLLLSRLLELYGDAYDVETAHLKQGSSDSLFRELFDHYLRDPNAVTRRFVRSAIERMDLILEQSPTRNADSSQRL